MNKCAWRSTTRTVAVLLTMAMGAAEAGRVSLVSYNMRHFQGCRAGEPTWGEWADKEWYPNPGEPGFYEFFARVLQSLDADIIAIQESPVSHHADGGYDEMGIVPELARRLGMHCYVQDRTRFHGFAALSRFPIVDVRDFSHNGTPGVGMIGFSVQMDQSVVLHVYNTHLHYQDASIRKAELTCYLQAIEQEGLHPHVLVGDFNIPAMASVELDPMVERGYLARHSLLGYVWVKEGGDVTILDFDTVENKLTSLELSGGTVVGSDHLPVKAVLDIGAQAPDWGRRADGGLKAVGPDGLPVPAGMGVAFPPGEFGVWPATDVGGKPRLSVVAVEGQPFAQALRIEMDRAADPPLETSVAASLPRPVRLGERVLLVFSARAASIPRGERWARLEYSFYSHVPRWRPHLFGGVRLTGDWQTVCMPFAIKESRAAGETGLAFYPGLGPGAIEIAGVGLLGYRDEAGRVESDLPLP